MRTKWLLFCLLAFWPCDPQAAAAETASPSLGTWTVGTPMVTYYAGPPLDERAARQMAEGGFNLVWAREKELDVARQHGLRTLLHDGLLAPATLDIPEQKQKLNDLIDRVRRHPALYGYFITDEPSAAAFPALGKLVAHLRERDPAHFAYINLFPTYANNQQLGTQGDTVTAYREHLRQYLEIVKPALVSYDHYQFAKNSDGQEYFLNLSMVRQAAQGAGVPFLNIVQACTWTPSMRVPGPEEMRYLVYTTLAYGAQGLSYYVYTAGGHTGGIALADGTPTPIYPVLKTLNREFVAIASALQSSKSLAIYHSALKQPGCEPLPPDAPFHLDPAQPADTAPGVLLGCFGQPSKPDHVLVVNLDYKTQTAVTVVGPGDWESFDATAGSWARTPGPKAALRLPPGGGKLLRVAR